MEWNRTEPINWEMVYRDSQANQREATLKFLLPAHEEEFKCAVNGSKYAGALWHVFSYLREKQKYYDGGSEEMEEALSAIYDDVVNIMKDKGYNPFDTD